MEIWQAMLHHHHRGLTLLALCHQTRSLLQNILKLKRDSFAGLYLKLDARTFDPSSAMNSKPAGTNCPFIWAKTASSVSFILAI
jgi:hypothetical protein